MALLASSCRTGEGTRGSYDELFEHLKGEGEPERGPLVPIGREEYAARRVRLGELLSRVRADAFLCEGGATMRYLSGVEWSLSERLFALIVLADGSHFFLAPAFEESRARLQIEGGAASGPGSGPGGAIATWQEHEYAFAPLQSALAERRAVRIVLDPAVRWFVARGMAATGLSTDADSAQLLLALRGRKDAHELALMRRANELTQRAISAVAEHLRKGHTGADVAAMVHSAQSSLGLRNTWVLALIGPDAALPHGGSQSAVLEPGEVVLIDAGGSLHGYQSDNTRTWVFDAKPTQFQSRVWHAVRDAQRAAFEALRPGRRCSEIDAIARDFLERAGFGPLYKHFTHRLGHGIGLEGHESPYFDLGSNVVLEEGMTLSDEPGVYIPGRLGVRIEDIVAITAEAADHFGSWQAGPDSPA
jgi:Xaa-Pro dipeptidase